MYNEEELIKVRDKWFQNLQDVYDGKNDVFKPFYLGGYLGRSETSPYENPEKWVDECVEDIRKNKAELIKNKDSFVPLCVEFGIYGVHYIDKMFGAEVYFKDGQWNAKYITSPIGQLKKPDLSKDEGFQLSIRAAKEFVKTGDKFILFGLPTIASPLNIAVNLYGQDILLEMLEDPENARKDLETITEVLCEIHKAFREIIPVQQLQPVISWERTQPPAYGQICGCTTQLVSGELYKSIIADLDERVLNVYPKGGMIHLCGKHSQHIETFRNMKALKAVQLNDRAAADLKLYYDGLREDQVIYLIPCKEMPLDEALKITNGGHRLIVNTGDLHIDILKD